MQKDSQEVALKFSSRQSSPVESHIHRRPSTSPDMCGLEVSLSAHNLSPNLPPEAGSSMKRVA